MEIVLAITVIIGLLLILFIGNYLIYKWIAGRAIRKIIKPYFSKIGYKIEGTRFVGLFKTGDFKWKGFPFRPFMHSGYLMQSVYIYVQLNKRETDTSIRITAKISTLFLFIRKVEYSKTLS